MRRSPLLLLAALLLVAATPQPTAADVVVEVDNRTTETLVIRVEGRREGDVQAGFRRAIRVRTAPAGRLRMSAMPVGGGRAYDAPDDFSSDHACWVWIIRPGAGGGADLDECRADRP